MDDQLVLVTGANGFLGREIVSRMLTSGPSIRVTDVNPTYPRSDIEYHQADIMEQEKLLPLVEGASTVIHSAGLAHLFDSRAEDEGLFNRINMVGTKNMVAAAKEAGVSHFILISSVSVYGPYSLGICDENTPCRPVGPYARSKYQGEIRAIEIAGNSGMALTILRLATLYGEGDPGNVGRLMRSLDRGRFVWIGDGSNRKSLLYKGDAARACLAVVGRSGTGVRVYNVSAPPCTMRDIVDGLAAELGKKPFPVRIPASVAASASKVLSCLPYKPLWGLHTAIQKWLSENIYDTSRIENDYGFHPQVELSEGLKREVQWYRQSQGSTRQRDPLLTT